MLAYAAMILLGSSIPSEEMPIGLPYNTDKVAHAIEYAILAFLLCWALGNSGMGAFAGVVIASTAYGALNELYQGLVPGRCPSFWDGVANAVGAIGACAVWRYRNTRGQTIRGPMILLTAFAVWQSTAYGVVQYLKCDDKIVLNDGTQLIGSVIFKSEKLVVIMIGGEEKLVERNTIKTIREGPAGPAATETKKEDAKTEPAAKPAPETTESVKNDKKVLDNATNPPDNKKGNPAGETPVAKKP